jgi:hypothetical protein
MQKINELLNSGKINAVEYYNYFKNRSAKTSPQPNRATTTSSQRQQRIKQFSSVPLASLTSGSRSKFNPYLIKNLQNSTQTVQQPALANEKKKDDAINRIIRNERIKQIRNKINEYELLKEYQKFDDQSKTKANGGDGGGGGDVVDNLDTMSIESDYGFIDDFNDDQMKKMKRSISYCDNWFANYDAHFDEDQQQDDVLVDADNDSITTIHRLNECSIDELIALATFKATGRRPTINTVNTRMQKSVKPGYELYQIGNLSISSQSTFQLKVSIIGAELKNVVNVLKQVCVNVRVFESLDKKRPKLQIDNGPLPTLFNPLDR